MFWTITLAALLPLRTRGLESRLDRLDEARKLPPQERERADFDIKVESARGGYGHSTASVQG